MKKQIGGLNFWKGSLILHREMEAYSDVRACTDIYLHVLDTIKGTNLQVRDDVRQGLQEELNA